MAKNEEEYNDFFDGPDIEEPVVEPTEEEKEEKQEREDTIAVIHNHRWRNFSISLICTIVAVLAVVIYFKYYSPRVDDSVETGHILKVEKRGLVFKTYEGEMITSTALKNTDKVYQRDFTFSFDNDSLAREAMHLQTTGDRVTLRYRSYDGVLPWRGSSKNIVFAIEIH